MMQQQQWAIYFSIFWAPSGAATVGGSQFEEGGDLNNGDYVTIFSSFLALCKFHLPKWMDMEQVAKQSKIIC